MTIKNNMIIREEIMNMISKYIDLDNCPDFNLIESIVFVKLILDLEEAFAFQFDDDKLSAYKFPTIASFVEYVIGKANQT